MGPVGQKDDGLSQARHALTRAALHTRFGLYRFGLPALTCAWYRGRPSRVAEIDVPEAMTMVANGLRCGAAPTDWIGTLWRFRSTICASSVGPAHPGCRPT
jgi:hypothetical protein